MPFVRQWNEKVRDLAKKSSSEGNRETEPEIAVNHNNVAVIELLKNNRSFGGKGNLVVVMN